MCIGTFCFHFLIYIIDFFIDEKKKKILKFLGQDKGEAREELGPINAAQERIKGTEKASPIHTLFHR